MGEKKDSRYGAWWFSVIVRFFYKSHAILNVRLSLSLQIERDQVVTNSLRIHIFKHFGQWRATWLLLLNVILEELWRRQCTFVSSKVVKSLEIDISNMCTSCSLPSVSNCKYFNKCVKSEYVCFGPKLLGAYIGYVGFGCIYRDVGSHFQYVFQEFWRHCYPHYVVRCRTATGWLFSMLFLGVGSLSLEIDISIQYMVPSECLGCR